MSDKAVTVKLYSSNLRSLEFTGINLDTQQKPHLILLAHGSKNQNWCLTFEKGLNSINGHLQQHASLAYMEMASPDLGSVIHEHYSRGVKNFHVLPLFFAAGRHLMHDVPEIITALHNQFDGVNIKLLNEVGSYDQFWQGLGRMLASEQIDSQP